jgi:hypothetical protein
VHAIGGELGRVEGVKRLQAGLHVHLSDRLDYGCQMGPDLVLRRRRNLRVGRDAGDTFEKVQFAD